MKREDDDEDDEDGGDVVLGNLVTLCLRTCLSQFNNNRFSLDGKTESFHCEQKKKKKKNGHMREHGAFWDCRPCGVFFGKSEQVFSRREDL